MSEPMICPAPAQLSGRAGGANALSQNEAAGRSGDGSRTDASGATEMPFASVLKSKIDNKPASQATSSSQAESPAAAAEPQAGTDKVTRGIDLATLFPMMGANAAPSGTQDQDKARQDAGTDDTGALALLPAANMTQIPAAAVAPAPTPVTAPHGASTMTVPTALRESGRDAREPAFEAGNPGGKRSPDHLPAAISGKIDPETAVTAESGSHPGGNNATETPAAEFHAFLERAAAMTSGTTASANSTSANTNLHVATPLGQAGWHDEMGQKLTWMVGNGHHQADLVLTPPQLGRVEVSLTLSGDQATAVFTSPNPVVREALETSLDRLREVLADAGVSLGQAQVGSESPNQSARGKEPGFGTKEDLGYASTIQAPAVEAISKARSRNGMIDIFA